MLVKMKSEPHDIVLRAVHTANPQATATAPQQEFIGKVIGAVPILEVDRHDIDDDGFSAVTAHGLEPGWW